MPISYDSEVKTWVLNNPSQEELEVLLEIGKRIIVNTASAGFTKEVFVKFLSELNKDHMFQA